jgi:hypothetical protein
MSSDRFIVQGFMAKSDPFLSDAFLLGHVKVLEDFGITNVTTNNSKWKDSKNVYVIICFDEETHDIVAGIRIEKKSASSILPIELAVSDYATSLVATVERDKLEGQVAEVCGLWNARRVFGYNLSHFLSEAAVAVLPHLDVKSAYCLVAHYTLELSLSLGFEILQNFGDSGWIPYPNDTYKAYGMRIADVNFLQSGNPEVVRSIIEIRNSLEGQVTVRGQRKNSIVSYNLLNVLP